MKFTFHSDLQDAGLSMRVRNTLVRAGIKGVSALCQEVFGPDDRHLLEVRNFGTKSLAEVIDLLYPNTVGMTYKVCLSEKGEDLADLIEADYAVGPADGRQWDIWGILGDLMVELNGAGEEGFWWPHIDIISTSHVVDIVSCFMSERGYDLMAMRKTIGEMTYALFVNEYIALELVEKQPWPSELLKDAPTNDSSS